MKLRLARLFATACASLLVAACATTEERFANARTLLDRDPIQALTTLGELCNAGDTPAPIRGAACLDAGDIEGRRNNHAQALQWMEKALALDPHNLHARHDLARAHLLLGQYHDARSHALRACGMRDDAREHAARSCGLYVKAVRAQVDQTSRPEPAHAAWIEASAGIHARLCGPGDPPAPIHTDRPWCAERGWLAAQTARLATERFKRAEAACLGGSATDCPAALEQLPERLEQRTERMQALRMQACRGGDGTMCAQLLADPAEAATALAADRTMLTEAFERLLPELDAICGDDADPRCEALLSRGEALRIAPLRARLAELRKSREIVLRQAPLRREVESVERSLIKAEYALAAAERPVAPDLTACGTQADVCQAACAAHTASEAGICPAKCVAQQSQCQRLAETRAAQQQRQQQTAARHEVAELHRQRKALLQRMDGLARTAEPAPLPEAPPKPAAVAKPPSPPSPVAVQRGRSDLPPSDALGCHSRSGDVLHFTHQYRNDPEMRRTLGETPRRSGDSVMNAVAGVSPEETLDALNRDFVGLLGAMESELQTALPLFDLPAQQVRALFASGDDSAFDFADSPAYTHFGNYWAHAYRANLLAAQIACLSRTEPSPIRPSGLSPIRRARAAVPPGSRSR